MSRSELPKGWEWKSLSDRDVAEIVMGQSPPSSAYNDDGNGLPFYQGKADFGTLCPKPQKWCTAPKKIALKNDILISVRAPVGPTNLCSEESCIGRGLAAIRPRNGNESLFLLHYLRSVESKVSLLGRGSTFSAIGKKELGEIRIPLPPLEEQKRIVARIEELLSRIEQAKSLRQKSLSETSAISHSAKLRVFGQARERWGTFEVNEICWKITDGTHTTPTYVDQGIPFLSVKNVREDGFDLSDMKYISEKEHAFLTKRCKPEKGDVLYTKVGTTGIAQEVSLDFEFSIFVSIALLKVRKDRVLPRYVQYALNSPTAREQALARTRGAANRNLVLKDIKPIRVPVPPLKEQRHIVAHLDRLQEKINELKRLQSKTQKELNQITQSILSKAFQGQL